MAFISQYWLPLLAAGTVIASLIVLLDARSDRKGK